MLQEWPERFFDFAWIPEFNVQLAELADQAEPEDWNYQHTYSEHQHPILFNYMHATYHRIAEEGKIILSEDGSYACFNTGLVTPNQEPLYAYFKANPREDVQPWLFKDWVRGGQWQMNRFSELPTLPDYIDDPASLVFDKRKSFRTNIEHMLAEDPRERFPEPFRSMTDFALRNLLDGAIGRAKDKAHRNYKAAIPQYHKGKIQLLLPLYLNDPQRADLALVVDSHGNTYRATTCLTLDMAYNNARLLAKPDSDWLQP